MLDDPVPVGGVGEAQLEELGIVHRLLQSVRKVPIPGLGLDHGDREVETVSKDIIRTLAGAARVAVADGDDPACREADLFLDLFVRPARAVKPGYHVSSAGIGFGHGLYVMAGSVEKIWKQDDSVLCRSVCALKFKVKTV